MSERLDRLEKIVESNAKAIQALASDATADREIARAERADLYRREGVLIEEMHRLIEISNRHENRINQLIGYSITDESVLASECRWQRYHLMERVMNVEKRLEQLENHQEG